MEKRKDTDIVMVLAGNSNVGKSAFFHQITGADVIVSNFPGTTVELVEGKVVYDNSTVRVIDLPGTYSLGSVAEDELVARKMILEGKPDVIVNIVDSTNLERNLFLTLQLIGLNFPMVVVLNMYDEALRKGVRIDAARLSKKLGVPVVHTVAVRGENVLKAFETAIDVAKKRERPRKIIRMGKDLEDIIAKLAKIIERNLARDFDIPTRALAIRLLEGDAYFIDLISSKRGGEKVLKSAEKFALEIMKRHGEAAALRIARERHGIANVIANEVSSYALAKPTVTDRLSRLTTEIKTGVPIMIAVFAGLLFTLLYVGGFLEGLIVDNYAKFVSPALRGFFASISPEESIARILDIGVNMGLEGILAVMFPYILVFFVLLAILEDVGYLPRMAFVMDSAMHKIGLHGRAVVPMLGGFGCNVPAIMGTRVLTSKRERFIASFLITMVPCSARTAVILGTVGFFIGVKYALMIYGIILLLIFIVGWTLNRILPGRVSGMVMEMPPLRMPMGRAILFKTWVRMKSFIYFATPLLLLGSLLIAVLQVSGLIYGIVAPLAPLTVGLLGLPPLTIIPLLYGFIRKEGALVLLTAIFGSSDLTAFMSPIQIFVCALVVAIYVPCAATIAILGRELGWKNAVLISVCTFLLAVILGGAVYHLSVL